MEAYPETFLGQAAAALAKEALEGFVLILAPGAVVGLILVYPLWRIFSRTGLVPALSLLVFVPGLGWLIVPAALAFNDWPVTEGARESAGWKIVSPVEAAENKYYGFKGWILYFYALVVLGLLMNGYNIWFNPTYSTLVLGLGVSFEMISIFIVVGFVLSIPFLVLAPMKHRLMPKVTIVCYWLVVILALANFTIFPVALALPGFVFGVIWAVLITWYLLKSKRVNVTYLHLVPSE